MLKTLLKQTFASTFYLLVKSIYHFIVTSTFRYIMCNLTDHPAFTEHMIILFTSFENGAETGISPAVWWWCAVVRLVLRLGRMPTKQPAAASPFLPSARFRRHWFSNRLPYSSSIDDDAVGLEPLAAALWAPYCCTTWFFQAMHNDPKSEK